jgi:hypothetical protein
MAARSLEESGDAPVVGERAGAGGLWGFGKLPGKGYIGALIFTASSIVVFTVAPVGMPIFFAS